MTHPAIEPDHPLHRSSGGPPKPGGYYIDGHYTDTAPAHSVSPSAAAFLYGEGVFETVRLYRGRPFRLQEHLRRLEHGLKVLEISPPAALAEAGDIIAALAQRNIPGTIDAMARLVVGAGAAAGNRAGTGSPGQPRSGGGEMAAHGITAATAGGIRTPETPPIFVVQVQPLDTAAIRRRQEGMTAMTLPWRRDAVNPLLKIKSLSYLENRHGLRLARRAGADEGVFINRNGDVTEGTFSNLFFIRGEAIVTPAPDAGLLPGITRLTIIELAQKLGLDCREAAVPDAALPEFDGAFLTSSLTEIAPLTAIDTGRYDPARTAALRQRLLAAYRELTRE
ncbi:MAG: aminotransferase class IV [Deltaproteobacteria bacterium]|nr:aminotransferase class IV [Candidatus Anaeroferrophillacea bacterium]